MPCIMLATCVLNKTVCYFLRNPRVYLSLLVCGSCTGANVRMGEFSEQSVTITTSTN